jgi:hypothetical protein
MTRTAAENNIIAIRLMIKSELSCGLYRICENCELSKNAISAASAIRTE